MCDIYTAGCQICDKALEMHLGDFATDRDEIEVYCEKCWPQFMLARPNHWTRYLVDSRPDSRTKLGDEKPWERTPVYDQTWVVAHLTPNAVDNRGVNHPNVWSYQMVDTEDGPIAQETGR